MHFKWRRFENFKTFRHISTGVASRAIYSKGKKKKLSPHFNKIYNPHFRNVLEFENFRAFDRISVAVLRRNEKIKQYIFG